MYTHMNTHFKNTYVATLSDFMIFYFATLHVYTKIIFGLWFSLWARLTSAKRFAVLIDVDFCSP